jgi:hypothetical protein
MHTAEDVAKWMVAKFDIANYLYQEQVVYEIRTLFGEKFVYVNANGNLAIGRDVLKHFKKLSAGKVVWERGDRAWRRLREHEPYLGRQVD